MANCQRKIKIWQLSQLKVKIQFGHNYNLKKCVSGLSVVCKMSAENTSFFRRSTNMPRSLAVKINPASCFVPVWPAFTKVA